jgi:hypothetical protein
MPQRVATAASKRRRFSTCWRTLGTNLAEILNQERWGRVVDVYAPRDSMVSDALTAGRERSGTLRNGPGRFLLCLDTRSGFGFESVTRWRLVPQE